MLFYVLYFHHWPFNLSVTLEPPDSNFKCPIFQSDLLLFLVDSNSDLWWVWNMHCLLHATVQASKMWGFHYFKKIIPIWLEQRPKMPYGASGWSVVQTLPYTRWLITSSRGKLSNESIMKPWCIQTLTGSRSENGSDCFSPICLINWNKSWLKTSEIELDSSQIYIWWLHMCYCLRRMTVGVRVCGWSLAYLSINWPRTTKLMHGFWLTQTQSKGVGGRRRSLLPPRTYRAFLGTPPASGSGSPRRTWPRRTPAAPEAATWAASWLGAAPSNHPDRRFGQSMLGGGDTGNAHAHTHTRTHAGVAVVTKRLSVCAWPCLLCCACVGISYCPDPLVCLTCGVFVPIEVVSLSEIPS